MLVAIIAAIATLVAAIVVIAVVFAVRSRTKSSNVSVKKDVRSISSVGVSSSLGDAGGRVGGGSTRSGPAQRPVANPSDNLKSRFVAMGVLAAAIFGSLTAKLWSMQILFSESYRSESEQNQYATVSTPAPRGFICDAGGNPLVKNRVSLTVLADLDVADNHDVVQRLSTVLGIPFNSVRRSIQDATAGAQSQRVVAGDVRLRDAAFITEHADAFKGVTVEPRTVRDYPYGALAAHALGYTGSVGDEDLKSVPEGRVIELGDDVGKSGVERQYDSLLAGDHGKRKVVANAEGEVVEVVSETKPTKGSDVHLTIAGPVQYVCDHALAELIAPEGGVIGTGKGVAASAVVMDVRDGGIVALSNYPTFSPEAFVGEIPTDIWDAYRDDKAFMPLLNRATEGQYPAASTYKTFTGLAALANGFADTKRTWDCEGSWDGWKTGIKKLCWNHNGHGAVTFRDAIVQSCDVAFYEMAKDFFDSSENGLTSETALQEFLSKYRFDQPTGIDLPTDSAGRIPTPEWKKDYYRDKPEEGIWQGGDLANMIIGQGYVLVTPMEVAVAYGAVATGKIMRPHVLKEVRNTSGDVVKSFEPEVVAEPDVDPTHLAVVREALNGVAVDNADISSVLSKHGLDPKTVACKTGTAEYTDQADTAWFACYAPFDDPKYVVACVVEHGGGGSAVAAPLGAEILAATLAYDAGELKDIGVVAGSTGKSKENAESAASTGRTD